MRETWNAARVGLMVALGLVVTFAVYRYVDERSTTESGYGVYAYFDDVQGLVAKSRVLVAGIPVGYISSIRLDGDRARVDLRIEGEIILYEDASVTMRSLSLLGERALVIRPGTPGMPEIPDGGEIRVADRGVNTDDIMVTVNDIANSVKRITAQLERAFGTEEAGDRMESALRNLSDALENIKTVTDEAGPRIVRIMENVELATDDLSEIIHKRKDEIDRGIGEVDDTIASIHQAADQLNAVLADVKEVTGRTARGEGTIGRLTQDEALIDEVEGVAEGLNSFVGGLNRLKAWLSQRKAAFRREEDAAHLDPPKGILLTGVQGCGKSLAAKATAGIFGAPLLRLDFGTLYDKYHGETERKLRESLKTADVMSPCVLWIDEIEKGIAGRGGETGTTQRVLGTFLTWMAERKSPVFVVATANDITALPPELVRKGRFDEIFFVDLPDAGVRSTILAIHLTNRGQRLGDFDVESLADAMQGFSGAEIEQAVVSALYAAHASNESLKSAHIQREIEQTKPLSTVMHEKISALRAWADGRTVPCD